MRAKKLFPLLLAICSGVSGQFYEFGQDPSSLKWKQLETENFKIIFPSDFSSKAQYLANHLENSYFLNSSQLDHQPRKIPLIIHNQTVYSNAFVTWAPKRMEFFTFPDPELSSMDWLQELSLHEFRHVTQIDKVNTGFTHFMSFILGQQITGAVAGMMPLWFIEGDAVSAETSLSLSGRGRMPSFEMELKAQLLSGKGPYSLSKAYLGSYRDFVPDYYRLGYQMVSTARKYYGDDYWTNALDYVSSHSYLLIPYFFYSEKITGGRQNLLYKKTISTIKSHWSETLSERNPEDLDSFNKKRNSTYQDYNRPVILDDSSILSYKTGLDIIPRFVRNYPGGKEEKVFIPGNLVSGRFSVNKDKILWDEYIQDMRWTNRSYSVLREFDIKTGVCRNITQNSRYLSPAWSPGGDSIVVVRVNPEYNFSLVVLNSSDGKVLLDIPSPENKYLQYPVWIVGTSEIAVITVGRNGKSIELYNLKSGEWTEIFKSGFIGIDHLNYGNKSLFFNGGFTGIDEIFSIDLNGRNLKKYTNSRYGSFYPDFSKRNRLLAFSGYNENGFDINLKGMDSGKEYSPQKVINEQSFVSASNSLLSVNAIESDTLKTAYPVRSYSKSLHLLRIHSWAPYWFDYSDPNIDDPKVTKGITLLSQNSLSTAFASLGFENSNGNNYFHSDFTYKGFYPVISFSSTYGGPPAVALIEDIDPPAVRPNLYYSASTYIPLLLTSGKIITGIRPSARFTYNSTYYYHLSERAYKRGILFFEPGIYFYSYLKTAFRDIQPRLGFILDAKYTSSPFENELYGNIKSLQLGFYLPGLLKNQGLRVRGEIQDQHVDSYYSQNNLILPRGYFQRTFINMKKISADYVFPIAYPDFSIQPFLYIKRIRGDVFIDYMKGIEKYELSGDRLVKSSPEYPLSQGMEIYADYHIFRFIFELSSGIRFIYFPHEQKYGLQILFNVNLDKF
jgi:hypothetical protein